MNTQKLQYQKIFVAIIFGAAIFSLSFIIFNQTQSVLMGIIIFLVVLWTNEGLPLAVVSLLPIVLFPMFHILSTKETSINYSNPMIYLFLGGFLLAIAVEKSGLHKFIANNMLRIFPKTIYGIILSLTITAGLLSAILSNTTTALLLIPIALYLTDDEKLKMRFSLAIAYGASVGGIITPIGTPPNLILLGIMQEHGLSQIPFLKWIIMVLPLAILMIFAVSFLLSLGTSKIKLETNFHSRRLTLPEKKVVVLLAGLVLLLFCNAPIHPYWNGLGLSEPVILLGCGLLLFVHPFQILDWMEDKNKIPFRIMFLFGAGFSIARAVSQTGLADELAKYILSLSVYSPIVMLIMIAAFITFATEVTSNTALISIMLPILYAVAHDAHLNVTLFMMVATISASYAFMLPIATPPNAIAMSCGCVTTKNMMRYGIILNLIGIALVVAIAQLYWKNILLG